MEKKKRITFSKKLLINSKIVSYSRRKKTIFLVCFRIAFIILVIIFGLTIPGVFEFYNHTQFSEAKTKNEMGFSPKNSKEIRERRTYNGKTYVNPDGSYTMEAHVGQIYYKDKKTGKMEEIDTTLKDNGDKWIMEKASYQADIPKYSDEPMEFQDVFEDKDQTITMIPQAEHVKGVIENSDGWKNKRIRYENAFGEGMDLRVTVGNMGLFKEVIVNKKPEKNEDLSFDFEVILPEGKDVFVLSNEAKKPKKISSFDDFELTGDNQLLIGFKNGDKDSFTKIQKVRVWDSEGNVISGKLKFFEKNGKVYFHKIIPKEFLEKAVYPVYTDDSASYYSGVGDGYVTKINADWNTAHDATSGTADYTASSDQPARTGRGSNGNFNMRRGFWPIDSSGLPSNAIISAATFSLYVTGKSDYDNDGDDWMNLFETTQGSETSLVDNDYDNCGSVDNPTEGATRIDIGDISTSAYNNWTLDSTGISWIKRSGESSSCGSTAGYTCLGMREGHDAIDSSFTGVAGSWNNINTYFSEQTGTTNDPYLSVTYSVPVISITVTSDGAVDYGYVPLDSEQDTTSSGVNNTQTVQNNGNVAEDFSIKTSHAVGGTQWSVGGTAGSNTFVHSFSTNSGSSWEALQTYDTYETLATGITASSSQDFDLKIHTPTSTSDYQEKTITVTIQASQS